MTRPPKKISEQPAKDRVTGKLIGRFKDLLAQGELIPGLKLPPERELAQRFGVSRPSLRQALKVLEIMGVLSQHVGDGTYLNSSASQILDEPMDFLVLMDSISHHELFEARLIVEPELAARAAERATPEDLSELRRSISAIQNNPADQKKVAEADIAFHEAVFRAAGNRVCHLMFRMIHWMVLTSMSTTGRLVQVGHTVRFHKRIYAAISNRDPKAAFEIMTAHLIDAREVLMKAGSSVPKLTPSTPASRSASRHRRFRVSAG